MSRTDATWAVVRGSAQPPEYRWFWSITVYVNPKLGITTSGRAPSLDEAKASFLDDWQKFPANSTLPEQPSIYRHVVVAFASLAGGVCCAVPPDRAPHPPSGAIWLHEIKHDGFRVIARKEGKRVRLYSRPGMI